MSPYLYGKSNSQPELPHQKAARPRQHPRQSYYLFNNCSTSLPSSPQHARNQSTPRGREQQGSQLQVFRKRFSNSRRHSAQHTKTQQHPLQQQTSHHNMHHMEPAGRVEGHQTLSSLLEDSRSSKHKKDVKTLHNFLFKGKHKTSCLAPQEHTSKEASIEFDDQQFRKSKSIMLIRKLAKTKEKLAQHRKDKQQEEFHKQQQIPIHHTQYHFNAHKAKTESSSTPQKDSLGHQRTNRAIQDILRLQEALKQQTQLQYKAEQEAPIFSRSIVNRFRMVSDEHYTKQYNFKGCKRKMLNGRPAKTIRKVSTKEEEVDFGPWKRNISGDFEGFF